MHKVTLDFTALKNEITTIQKEAFRGVETTNSNERRDILLKVTERLKALKTNLDTGNVVFEVK